MRDLKARVRRSDIWAGAGLDVWAFVPQENGDTLVAQPVTMQRIPHGELMPRMPTFTLNPDEAQALMDSLWDCGLRPSEGSGSAGALAATQRHLEDMRALVFDRPKPSGGGR